MKKAFHNKSALITLWLGFLLVGALLPAWAQNTPKDIIQSFELTEELLADTLPVKVKVLPAIINSDFSEYKGVLFPDSTFIFTALHAKGARHNETIFNPFWTTQMYTSTLTESGYTTPMALSKNINNKNYYTSNFAFNNDHTLVYFTRCNKTDNVELKCHIWKSEFAEGEWQKATKLPASINAPSSNTSFPHLVEKEKYNILYFASNRPNGHGGMDIWYVILDEYYSQEAVNLGPNINSIGDEITPFYDVVGKKLFFSSDEWTGIGGYDIFYSNGELSQWKESRNLGFPFNSKYNDFYFVINAHNRNGYFSSNRPNRLHAGGDDCCNDLFSFRWIEEEVTREQLSALQLTDAARQLLPITLYFANDEPNPKSNDTTTLENYEAMLANYLALKKKYITIYGELANGEESKQKMGAFFQDSVILGYKKLEQFAENIEKLLVEGKKIEIQINGFASALHISDYNARLSQRRIASIVNYFKEYNYGSLQPYIDNSTFKFVTQPYGSDQAQTLPKTKQRDKRYAVYSLLFALDRRVEISVIEVK